MDSENRNPEGGLDPSPEAVKGLRDFLGALLLFLVSVAFAIASLQIPFKSSYWVWYTSPGIFALVMAICLGCCSAAVGYRGFRVWRKNRLTSGPIPWGERLRAWGIKRFISAVAMITVYLLLLGRVPFLIISVALVLAFGITFREGRFRDALRSSLIASAVVVLVAFFISRVFGILFP